MSRNITLFDAGLELWGRGVGPDALLNHLITHPQRNGLPQREIIEMHRWITKTLDPAKPRIPEDVYLSMDPLDELCLRRGWERACVVSVAAPATGERGQRTIEFPMRNATGEITGTRIRLASGSAFGKGQKCLTRKGGKHGVICPWPFPEGETVLVVEGEADVCAALSAGHAATVGLPGATPGRDAYTAIQILLARRECVLAPDPDEAGRKWLAVTAEKLLNAGCRVRHIIPTDGDLDDRLRREEDRAAALDAIIAGAQEWKNQDTPKPDTSHRLDDIANGERFAKQHRGRAIFCPAFGWLTYDGARWQNDGDEIAVTGLAKHTARSIFDEAARCAGDDSVKVKLAQWASKSAASGRLAAMIHLAKSEPDMNAPASVFDANDFILNTPTETILLSDPPTSRPHNPTDLLTKVTGVPRKPGAAAPVWNAFIDRIFGDDPELVSYVQRAVGYSLTSDTREQCFFLLIGTGSNGKSTFLEAVAHALGDYAKQADANSFLADDHVNVGGPRPDLVALVGARFVRAVEIDKGKRLAEALVKSLTGSDRQMIRGLYRAPFEWFPNFKLWLAANHKPEIRGSDDGIWRRIRLIPFNVKFEGAAKDVTLPARLKEEAPGILEWAIQGYIQWARHGLQEPPSVIAATTGYRHESDRIGAFLADECIVSPSWGCTAANLWEAYSAWAAEQEITPLSQIKLAKTLQEKGFNSKKINGVKQWTGFKIND